VQRDKTYVTGKNSFMKRALITGKIDSWPRALIDVPEALTKPCPAGMMTRKKAKNI
jgi:hypothetical protein